MEIPPSKNTLQVMLDGALMMEGVAREVMLNNLKDTIKEYKLQIAISGNQLVEIGDSTEACLARFITVNDAMLSLKNDVRKLALINEDEHQLFSVLILGESGTGKELIARALHGDRDTKFLGINCAGLPESLIESELFGHVQGAFTNATSTKQGLMKSVGTGTLFLDEIGELAMPVQAKLLRAIQQKRVRKVGAEKEEDIACRLVCATHHDLETMAHTVPEQFRLDLYGRISTFQLKVLPLKDRLEDILPILKSLNGGEQFLNGLQWTDISYLERLDLSLNVRSLQQHVKRYNVLGKLP